MSDDFDKEAEREKLREKYERDKAEREATEQMSELLLQGATMTNRHCEECHSPVFRYDGREFCPTCEQEMTEGGGEGDTTEPTETDRASSPEAAETSTSDGTEAAVSGGEPSASEDGRPEPTHSEPPRTRGSDAPPADQERHEDRRPTPAPDRRPVTPDPPARRPGDSDRPADRDLGETEASLRRTLSELVDGAEMTDDVGRKRTLLSAAKEAAETLEVVKRL
ncbi:MAG: Sjogren's syndrome/scleroderma autoantigen 1 family protein [Natronomonas sp.]